MALVSRVLMHCIPLLCYRSASNVVMSTIRSRLTSNSSLANSNNNNANNAAMRQATQATIM